MRETRRGSRSRGRRCARESCTRKCHREYEYCSPICRAWAQELEQLEQAIREAGTGRIAGETWAVAVEVNDLLTDITRKKHLLKNIIRQRNQSKVSGETAAEGSNQTKSNQTAETLPHT